MGEDKDKREREGKERRGKDAKEMIMVCANSMDWNKQDGVAYRK